MFPSPSFTLCKIVDNLKKKKMEEQVNFSLKGLGAALSQFCLVISHLSLAVSQSSLVVGQLSVTIGQFIVAFSQISAAVSQVVFVVGRLGGCVYRLSVGLRRLSDGFNSFSREVRAFSITMSQFSVAFRQFSFTVNEFRYVAQRIAGAFGRDRRLERLSQLLQEIAGAVGKAGVAFGDFSLILSLFGLLNVQFYKVACFHLVSAQTGVHVVRCSLRMKKLSVGVHQLSLAIFQLSVTSRHVGLAIAQYVAITKEIRKSRSLFKSAINLNCLCDCLRLLSRKMCFVLFSIRNSFNLLKNKIVSNNNNNNKDNNRENKIQIYKPNKDSKLQYKLHLLKSICSDDFNVKFRNNIIAGGFKSEDTALLKFHLSRMPQDFSALNCAVGRNALDGGEIKNTPNEYGSKASGSEFVGRAEAGGIEAPHDPKGPAAVGEEMSWIIEREFVRCCRVYDRVLCVLCNWRECSDAGRETSRALVCRIFDGRVRVGPAPECDPRNVPVYCDFYVFV